MGFYCNGRKGVCPNPDVCVDDCEFCDGSGGEYFTSNGDRIRAMTDEKLAEWLVGKTFYRESAWSEPSYLNLLTGRSATREAAVSGTKEWLQQPAEVEDGR